MATNAAAKGLSGAACLGHKLIETRSWETSYRGPIAIHASKRWTHAERSMASVYSRTFPEVVWPENFPLGQIVAVANLKSVVPVAAITPMMTAKEWAFGDYTPGRFGWMLEDVRPLEMTYPCVGRQGLFKLSDAMTSEITDQLNHAGWYSTKADEGLAQA